MFDAIADIFNSIIFGIKFAIAVIIVFAIWCTFRRITRSSRESKRFPAKDMRGKPLEKTMAFTLSGVNHEHDGSDPQKVFKQGIPAKSELRLQADPKNRYDKHAIKVFYGDQYIGWIPNTGISSAERKMKDLIFERIQSGATVLAQFDGYNRTKVYEAPDDLDESDNDDIDDEDLGAEEDHYQWYKTCDVLCAVYAE